MIKILFSLVLLCGFMGEAMATPYDENLETHDIKNAQKTIILKNLDFKTVMMAFYQKDIQHIVIPELDKNKEQYVGMKKDQDGLVHVLIYAKPKQYLDNQKQERYLLTVSQVVVDEDLKEIQYCWVCTSSTDIYVFKINTDKKFELVASATGEDGWWGDSREDNTFSPEMILGGLGPVGPQVKGYIEEIELSKQGYTTTTLFIAPFNDRKNLKKLEIANTYESNDITGDERVYKTQGKYQFLKSVHDGLYDIEIQYSGTQRKQTKDDFKVIPMRETHIYQYNEKQKKYVRVK